MDTDFFRPIDWTANDDSTSSIITTRTAKATATEKRTEIKTATVEDDMSLLQALIHSMTMTMAQGKDDFLSLVDMKRKSLENPSVPYPTIFLFVGKWEDRKGIKTLLKAYYTTFTRDDNVLLVLLTNAYHSSDQVITYPISISCTDQQTNPCHCQCMY